MAEAQPISVKGEVRIEEPTAAQRTVARRTAEARATVPHIEMSAEAEMTAALAQREREREGDPERWSLTALFVRSCALALRELPYANAAYRDGRFELYSRINVGVVVTGGETYVIPTVFDADRKTLPELTAEIEKLRRDALARTLAAPAFSGATFTLWNAGAHGLSSSSLVINPPQAGALAFGLVRSAPALESAQAIPRRTMTIMLACDHRILYGDRASRFLATVKARLEGPAP